MQIPDVDYLAILVGAVVYYALGAVWYQPGVFGAAWMKSIGKSPEDLRNSGGAALLTSMVGMGVLALVSVVALAWIIAWAEAGTVTVTGAVGVTLVVVIGFHLTAWGTTVLFDQRPWSYLVINMGYHLIGLVLAAVVLTIWP